MRRRTADLEAMSPDKLVLLWEHWPADTDKHREITDAGWDVIDYIRARRWIRRGRRRTEQPW